MLSAQVPRTCRHRAVLKRVTVTPPEGEFMIVRFMNLNPFLSVGLFTAFFSLVPAAALAGDEKPEPKPTQAITFEELKSRCLNPGQFNEQHAPQNISVVCSDISTTWLAAAPGEIPLPGTRSVTFGILSDKWHVDAVTASVATLGKGGSCLRFEEVRNTFSVQQSLSCEQILNMKEDLATYCASSLDKGKGQNPKLVDVVRTGNVIDNCPKTDSSKPSNGGGKTSLF